MKSLFMVLSIIVVLSIGFVGCGGDANTSKGNTQNKSEAVVALVNDTVKIYEEYATQLESSLASGQKLTEIINGLKPLCERYESRMQVEIGSELNALETNEIRSFYFAIAGNEAEQHDLVDPRIKTAVEKLRNMAAGTPAADHAKGYAIQFINRSGSMAFSAIADSLKK